MRDPSKRGPDARLMTASKAKNKTTSAGRPTPIFAPERRPRQGPLGLMGTKDKIEKLMSDPEAAARVHAYLKADYEAVALADLCQRQVPQADLATLMGVSPRRVSAIENTSNPRVDTLRAYTSKLGYELVLRARSSTGEEIPVRLGG